MSRGLEIVVLSVGGALGVNARYWLATWMATWAGDRFPWATFTINVSGSFAIGVLATILARWLPQHPARLFLLVGFLGGYTTFSSFAIEGHVLWERGAIARAVVYLGGSVAAGFVAVVLGVMLGRAIVGPDTSPSGRLVATNDLRGLDE